MAAEPSELVCQAQLQQVEKSAPPGQPGGSCVVMFWGITGRLGGKESWSASREAGVTGRGHEGLVSWVRSGPAL